LGKVPVVEADQVDVEVLRLKRRKLCPEKIFVPACVERELIVGDDVSPLLCLAEMIQNDHGYLGQSQPPGGEEAAVAGDDARFGVYKDRVIEPKLCNACRNLGDLRVGMRPGIPDQGNQLVDQPQLDVFHHWLPGHLRLRMGLAFALFAIPLCH